jgi:MerR family transcriptional regulator, light-induced transcriptional regulator
LSSSLHPSFDPGETGDCEPPRKRAGTIGQALEFDLIPRLLAHARATAGQHAAHPPLTIGDVERFVADLLHPDENRATDRVEALRSAGASLEQICLELFSPAARDLGVRWEEDESDFLDVTVGLGRMQRILREIGASINASISADAGQAFLCGLREEQHSLGLAMVAEFFVVDGWGVTVGPPLGVNDVEQEVRLRWYDVVGVSTGLGERIPKVRDMIARIREASVNPDLAVLVGGRAFQEDPTLVERVGADASAPDAAQAPMVARTLVQLSRASREEADGDGDRTQALL